MKLPSLKKAPNAALTRAVASAQPEKAEANVTGVSDNGVHLGTATNQPSAQPSPSTSDDLSLDDVDLNSRETKLRQGKTNHSAPISKGPNYPRKPMEALNPFLKRQSKPRAKLPSKKSNQLLWLLVLSLALAALAWYFFGQSSASNQPTSPTPTQLKPKAATHTQPAIGTPPVTSQASTTSPTAAAIAVDDASSSAQATTAVPTITPEEIMKPTLPEDPAIAKEEMMRLSEQSAQLTEQEAMMQDQLRMMNELSDKKEERIKLLERQIAQLEQQNASNK